MYAGTEYNLSRYVQNTQNYFIFLNYSYKIKTS